MVNLMDCSALREVKSERIRKNDLLKGEIHLVDDKTKFEYGFESA